MEDKKVSNDNEQINVDWLINDAEYWTPVRRDLVLWLNDHAPSFAPAYAGSVRILFDGPLPGKIHFICHIVRDIYNRLPRVLGTDERAMQAGDVFPPLIKQIVSNWNDEQISDAPKIQGEPSMVKVPAKLHRSVKNLVDKSKEFPKQTNVGQRLGVALIRLLPDPTEIPSTELINALNTAYDWFVGRAHLVHEVDKIPKEDGLVDKFEAFEDTFHAFIGSYFMIMSELDSVLEKTNS